MTFTVGIVVLYFCSRIFKLILIAQLIKLLFPVILIIIAIVFQRDIRRFIEQLSFKFSSYQGEVDLILTHKDKICRVIKNLSEKKIGAILVFVGNSPVANSVTGGKALSSELDSDLVESIFDPRTPGHDGAMVIDGAKISRISCQLPLSKGTRLSPKLGTRHSAAIGLSERADCLICVVSEERGTVSLAENGRLIYDVSDKFLKSKLSHYVKSQLKRRRTSRNFLSYFKNNFPLKITSLLVALIAWGATIYEPGISYTSFMMPVEVRNLRHEMTINSISDDIVKVTLSGPSSYVNQLKKKTQKLMLDFQDAKDGKTTFHSGEFQMNFPENITIHGYQPNTITAYLVEYQSRKLPVILKTKGKLSSQFDVAEVVMSPSQKNVLFPKKMQQENLVILTNEIDLSEVSPENPLVKAKVLLPEGVRLKNKESIYVEVKFKLNQETL